MLTDKATVVTQIGLDCSKEHHTPCPEGYIQWCAWAEEMMETHKQERCPECNLWAVWVPAYGRHRHA